jgi:hypothetical protein
MLKMINYEETPDIRVGSIINYKGQDDDYDVCFKIDYLNGMPYRAFFIDRDGNTWYSKIGDLESVVVHISDYTKPNGVKQVWPVEFTEKSHPELCQLLSDAFSEHENGDSEEVTN